MREIRPSSLEGGVRLIPHPYPYQKNVRCAISKTNYVALGVGVWHKTGPILI